MASKRQIEANRNNAKRSTGPKTPDGKAKSGRNALRHGLARIRCSDDAEIAGLVGAISASLGHHAASNVLMDIARSKLALLRIRAIRREMLIALLQGPASACAKRLQGLERYERAALVQQRRALRLLSLERG